MNSPRRVKNDGRSGAGKAVCSSQLFESEAEMIDTRGKKRGGKTAMSSPFQSGIADMHKGRGKRMMGGKRGKKR